MNLCDADSAESEWCAVCVSLLSGASCFLPVGKETSPQTAVVVLFNFFPDCIENFCIAVFNIL